MPYIFYVLRSRIDGSYYRGQTSNLTKRIKEHNRGGTRSTKSRMPWHVVYIEEYLSRSEAVGRERYLKSPAGWKEWQEIGRIIERRATSVRYKSHWK